MCFSDLGHNVVCVDNNIKKIENLKKGFIPIFEPGLDELVKKNYKARRLNFTTDIAYSVKKSNLVFICVGTPAKKKSYSADLTQIFKVVNLISKNINKFKIIITKSTVPVTTGDEIEKILSKNPKKIFAVEKDFKLTSILKENYKNFKHINNMLE